jgi:hypothetical protein
MTLLSRIAGAIASALVVAGCTSERASATAATDDPELERTFLQGRAHYRDAGGLHETSIEAAWPTLRTQPRGRFRALIVYLHGCDGVGRHDTRTADSVTFRADFPPSIAPPIRGTGAAPTSVGGSSRASRALHEDTARLASGNLDGYDHSSAERDRVMTGWRAGRTSSLRRNRECSKISDGQAAEPGGSYARRNSSRIVLRTTLSMVSAWMACFSASLINVW